MEKQFKFVEIYAKEKMDKKSHMTFANCSLEYALKEFYRFWSHDDIDFIFIRN